MKTKSRFFIVAISVVFIFTVMAFFADKISIGVTHH